MKNMMTPQTKAMAIHTSSPRATGSFHQTRSCGGFIAISPLLLHEIDEPDVGDLHHAPQNIDDGRDHHAEKQKEERVVENPLHERNAHRGFRRPARFLGLSHVSFRRSDEMALLPALPGLRSDALTKVKAPVRGRRRGAKPSGGPAWRSGRR